MTLAQELRPALREARKRSLRSGKPVLASVSVPCRDIDPVAIFERSDAGTRVLWHQPAEGFAAVAIGAAWRLTAHGAERFATVRSGWQEALEDFVAGGTSLPFATPLAMASFAFGTRREQEGPPGFPEALILVPRLLFVQKDGRSWVNATLMATAETDAETAAQEIEEDASRLLAREDSPCREQRTTGSLSPDDGADQEPWEAAVSSILGEIDSGAVEKVVLARSVVAASDSPIVVATALRRLASRYPHCTVFAHALADVCFVGATPERLLRLEDSSVWIDCLAGSTARGRNQTADADLARKLLNDPKELHEHRIVVRALREALGPLCHDVEAADQPAILQTANLQHLYTPVTAVAKPGHDIFDFVERLHPTPATGGYPRAEALALIEKHEVFDRGWYAGPCGWIDSQGNGEFVVAIRSALLEEYRATLYAGSGIVAGSDPRREYEETALKLQTMLWALGQE